MRRRLIVLADLLRADLAAFASAVEAGELEKAAESLATFRTRCDEAAKELRQ